MFFHAKKRHPIAKATKAFHVALLGCFALQQGANAQTTDESTTLETVIVTASRTPDTALILPIALSLIHI